MKQPQSITSLPESPDAERRRRMTRYLITMVIRVACIILCLFVHGWWLLLPIIGAIVLPYVAVVFANVGSSNGGDVERPGAIVRSQRPSTAQKNDRRGGMIGAAGPSTERCSRAGCIELATWNVNWRNPKIHSADRVKVWLACDEHVEYLRDYLATRDFPVVVTGVGHPVDRVGS